METIEKENARSTKTGTLDGACTHQNSVTSILPAHASVNTYFSTKRQSGLSPDNGDLPTVNTYLQKAQLYLAAGMFSLPITPGQKKPAVCWSEDFPGTKRPTPDKLNEWWEKFPDSEVGFITGKRSGRIVIDVDDLDSLQELEEKLGPLPGTQTVITGRGYHYHFEYPRGKKIQCGTLAPGIHVKADGGLCVLPPSLHRDTWKPYTWAAGHAWGDIDLAPLPDAWLKALIAENKPTRTKPATPNTVEIPGKGYIEKVPSLGTPPLLVSDFDIREPYTRLENLPALCEVLGIPVHQVGKKFCCVLPGHDEQHPSASLYREPGGLIVYKDFHHAGGCYSLPQVRMSQAYGKLIERNGNSGLGEAEYMTWSLRLLIEAGIIQPAPVDSLILPANAKKSVKKVWEGFRLLLGCKWLLKPGQPTTFTRRFASNWCGLAERHAVEAVKQLLRMGMIEQAGEMRCGGHTVMLFRPGKTARWKQD